MRQIFAGHANHWGVIVHIDYLASGGSAGQEQTNQGQGRDDLTRKEIG
jgi:hypothetical protein